jgi:hypothetical protein
MIMMLLRFKFDEFVKSGKEGIISQLFSCVPFAQICNFFLKASIFITQIKDSSHTTLETQILLIY